jgi:hypothetical protein
MESRIPELRALLDELDRLVPKEGARLRIPSDPDGNATIGTQLGYLRLGVEFLRAALVPPEGTDEGSTPHIPLDIQYLLTPGSETPFDLCEIDEDVERLPPPVRKLGAIGQLLAAVFGVVIVGLIVVGAVAVLSWMVH